MALTTTRLACPRTPAFTGGVHNLFHTAASPTASLRGRETLSLFVNSVQGGVSSFAYEFELKLAPPQRPGVPPTDAVRNSGLHPRSPTKTPRCSTDKIDLVW